MRWTPAGSTRIWCAAQRFKAHTLRYSDAARGSWLWCFRPVVGMSTFTQATTHTSALFAGVRSCMPCMLNPPVRSSPRKQNCHKLCHRRTESYELCAPDEEGRHARDVRQLPERAHQRVAEHRAQRHAGQQLGCGLEDQRAVARLRLALLLVCAVVLVRITGRAPVQDRPSWSYQEIPQTITTLHIRLQAEGMSDYDRKHSFNEPNLI